MRLLVCGGDLTSAGLVIFFESTFEFRIHIFGPIVLIDDSSFELFILNHEARLHGFRRPALVGMVLCALFRYAIHASKLRCKSIDFAEDIAMQFFDSSLK